MEPLFKTSFLGLSVKVFPDRVVYSRWGVGDQIILAKQIASVEMSVVGVMELTIETTGGKKYPIVVYLDHKQALRDAILSIT